MSDLFDALATIRDWRNDDAELRVPSGPWGEKLIAAIDAVVAAAEPDLGDGTAPPEENFWDDRTTPHVYGESDALREQEAREAGWDAIKAHPRYVGANPQAWFLAGWEARNRYTA